MKQIKKRVWARVLRSFTSFGLFRAAWLYWLTPTFGWMILVGVLFALLAILTYIITHGETPPIALLWVC